MKGFEKVLFSCLTLFIFSSNAVEVQTLMIGIGIPITVVAQQQYSNVVFHGLVASER